MSIFKSTNFQINSLTNEQQQIHIRTKPNQKVW